MPQPARDGYQAVAMPIAFASPLLASEEQDPDLIGVLQE